MVDVRRVHSASVVKCPKCGNDILSSYRDGKTKLRSPILIWDDKGCVAKCPGCKAEVEVPVKLDLPPEKKTRMVHIVRI